MWIILYRHAYHNTWLQLSQIQHEEATAKKLEAQFNNSDSPYPLMEFMAVPLESAKVLMMLMNGK